LRTTVRRNTRQLAVLIIGSSLGAIGWGAVLPFLYADISTARHLGPSVAAVAFTAFALGALLAAPIAGQLADRARPVVVATAARLAMVLTIAGLMYARDPLEIWVFALADGAALAVLQPAISVMVLSITSPEQRRDVFAWQFIGQNLALAIGGFVGGFLVDLSTPTGARPAYAFAALASLASAAMVVVVGRRVEREQVSVSEPAEDVDYRTVFRAPGVKWMLAVTGLLTLAFYAQYDSGLPAYALSVLNVQPTVLGTAVAINAILVALMTAPVVKATRSVSPAVLLATCAAMWIAVWAVLAMPLLHIGSASAIIIAGYALFSVGETMLAPVLSPLAASLAPAGATGRTLAAMNGAQTLATAVGPGLSGLMLGMGLPEGFIVMQVLCCVVSIVGTRRLARVMPARPRRDQLALAR
jgi:MFS family permease